MKKKNQVLHLVIIPVFIAELISRWYGFHTLDYFTKPLLMIWIAFYYFLNTDFQKKDLFIYTAFLFSWLGDIFLMLTHLNEMLFYAGVGGFFFAQLSYIKVFIDNSGEVKGFLSNKPIWILPFVFYLGFILAIISGGMKGIMIPIIVIYAFSLLSMSAAALNRKSLTGKRSFFLVFSGSVLFVVSDSMIAINKFYTELPNSSFLIMLTYFTAQYLIMQGLISARKETF
jgi:uncharacterized membrane protein YhhN